MNKWILIITTLCAATLCYAYNPLTPSNLSKKPIPVSTAVTQWMSPNSMSTYYIQTGSPMTITIKVYNNSAGVTLSNCAGGRGVSPGAGTVCSVMNSSAPVGITSTSQTAQAIGTFQKNPR